MVNRLHPEKQVALLQDMMERMSIRGLHRTKQGNTGKSGRPSRTTIQKLLADAGDTAIEFLDERMRDLPSTLIEADECHSYVGIRGRTLWARKMRAPVGMGVFWIWIAIDAKSKLIVAWHIGGRGHDDARAFINDLKDRCPRRLQITTDSHLPYFSAIENAWGGEVDYATVKKQDEQQQEVIEEYLGVGQQPKKRRARREKAPPEIRSGDPDMALVTTNHIESFFQKFRQNLGRLGRRTTLFSKTLTNLKRSVALYVFYHNFIRIHMTLKTTPAVASGIDDSVWAWRDFVDLVDDYRAAKKAEPVEEEEAVEVVCQPSAPPEDDAPFVVMCSLTHRYAKIHASSCKHLREAPDRTSKKGGSQKFRCETIEKARNLAYDLVPDEVAECRICLGDYYCLGSGRGRGGSKLKR
ncbi:hypothetical protein ABC365_09340 [Brevundimonas sp. 3P9-tot-E]|uniref:hypothetical protein n=1 Tax=unclassified Brevundimonas TaxID=2622653 RepID=UPI0039A2AC0D